MKKTALFLACAAIVPLSAQSWEAGLFVGSQALKSGSVALTSTSRETIDMDNKVVYGIRLGRSVVNFGPVLFQVTVGYQPSATSKLHWTDYQDNTAPAPTLTLRTQNGFGRTPAGAMVQVDAGTDDFKTSNYSVGAMFNFKAFVSLGAGLEYRFEKLEDNGHSTNYARPWVRLNAGIAIPSPVIKPFVGIEASFPLVSKDVADARSEDDYLKGLAPKSQIGIYAGIRF